MRIDFNVFISVITYQICDHQKVFVSSIDRFKVSARGIRQLTLPSTLFNYDSMLESIPIVRRYRLFYFMLRNLMLKPRFTIDFRIMLRGDTLALLVSYYPSAPH